MTDYIQQEILKFNKLRNGKSFCIGITPWKRKNFCEFLGGEDNVKFISIKEYETAIALAKYYNTQVICWSSSKPEKIEEKCKEHGVKLIFVEDGFIRSSGLGIKLNLPASLCFSSPGIHYDATQPSELENILNSSKESDVDRDRVANIINYLKSQKISKYGSGSKGKTWGPSNFDRKKILVIGQVEDDASIKLGTHKTKTNLDLIKACRAMRPYDYIAYKPHPDVESNLRLGKVNEKTALNYVDEVLQNIDTYDALEHCDEVHVMSSQTGFEALILSKNVVCHGHPFYSGWGLTEDTVPNPRRINKLSLEQLISSVIIEYPLYMHPSTYEITTPEEIMKLISDKSYIWPHAPKWMISAVFFKRIYRKIIKWKNLFNKKSVTT